MKLAKWIFFICAWTGLALFSVYLEGNGPEKVYWRTAIQQELPGPKDIWGGNRFHKIVIKKTLPQEGAILWLHTQDAHNQYPPRLQIALDQILVGEIQIKPGRGNPTQKEGLPGSYSLHLKVSPEPLKETHEILIKNTRGSWVRMEAIELTSVKKAFSISELSKPNLSSYQVFYLWLLGLGLCWGLFWLEKNFWFYSLIAFSYTAVLVFFNLYSFNFPGMWGFGAFLHFPKGIKILASYGLIGFFIFSFPSRIRLKTWQKGVALGTLPILFFLIRSFNDPPDGAQWVRFVPEGIFFPREPLATYIQHLFYVGVKSFIPNPREALSLLSILLGVLGTFFLWKWAKTIFDTMEESVFFTLGLLTSFGFVGLFLGHIETYPILVVALIGYLWSVSLCLKKGGHPKWPTLWLSLALMIHLGAVWLLPAHVYILIYWIRKDTPDLLKGLRDLVLYALFPVILVMGLMVFQGSSITTWVKDLFHVFPEKVSPFYSLKEMISWSHWKDVINEHFYLAPTLLLLLLLALMNPITDPVVLFLFLGFFSFELYTLTYKPGLGAQRDWDLFSPLTFLALGYLWSSLRKKPFFKLLIIPLIGLSLFQTLPLAWRNHQSTNFVFVKEIQKPDLPIPKDWMLLDTLDVGNSQDEIRHQYGIKNEARSPIPHFGTVPESEIKCAGDQAFLWDRGRAHQEAESFSVQARVGAPLVIVKRFHGDIANQSVKVLVSGKEIGLWEIPGRAKNSFRSSFFLIPSSFIQNDQVQLTFQALAPDRLVTSYYYWIYVPSKTTLFGAIKERDKIELSRSGQQ